LNELGMFDRNQYYAPRANHVISKYIGHPDICAATEVFCLLNWQQCTGADKSSQFAMVGGAGNESAGPNLIRNSYMTNNTEGWIAWPSPVSIMHDKTKGEGG